jgi:hypothetical protein
MWLMTKYGFYSVVEKLPGEFHFRSREKRDLQNLLHAAGAIGKIHRSRNADYPFRVVTGAAGKRRLMQAVESSIDYPNFKDKIAGTKSQSRKLNAYHRIWADMRSTQHT